MKNKNLKHVWDNHAASRNYKMPNVKELLDANDFITNYLFSIKAKKNKKVLDAGCGIGQYVTAARLFGFEAEGIDISPKAVKIARERGEKAMVGDVRKLPYKSRTFDIVVSGGVLEHFPETGKAVKEVARVLENNGLFIGNVPYKYSLIFGLNRKIQNIFGIWKAGYEKTFSFKEFKNLLENEGLKVLEMRTRRIAGGRHKILSLLLRSIDEPLFMIGLGGAHFYFVCRKNKGEKR